MNCDRWLNESYFNSDKPRALSKDNALMKEALDMFALRSGGQMWFYLFILIFHGLLSMLTSCFTS